MQSISPVYRIIHVLTACNRIAIELFEILQVEFQNPHFLKLLGIQE
ncbi:hypothetical protein Cal6303_4747 [Calothrix sp. PCC 6303]|nr:hypothetical protein Cal6303_4747 [Calothrix sp. PCC 6303]